MIRFIMRRDPLFPIFISSLFTGLLLSTSIVVLGNLSGDVLAGGTLVYAFLYCAIAVAFSGFMSPAAIKQRFDELWLAAPISAKTLSRARYLMMLGTCLTPTLLIMVGVRAGQPGLISPAPFLGHVASIALAIAVSNQRAHGKNILTPRDWIPGMAILVLGPIVTIAVNSLWLSAGVAALAIVALINSWMTTPDWIDANRPAEQANHTISTASGELTSGENASRLSLESGLLVQATLRNPIWIVQVLSFTVMAAIVIKMGGPAIAFLPILVHNVYKLNLFGANVLRSAGHLPINRWKMAPVIVLTPLILGMLGILLAGQIFDRTATTGYPYQIGLQAKSFHLDGKKEIFTKLQVPDIFWTLHFGSQPVVVELPASDSRATERLELTVHRPLSFLPIGVINPYETRPESSPDFAAMQLSHLVRAGFAVELTEAEILEKYLELSDAGFVKKKSTGGTEAQPGHYDSFRERFEETELLHQPGSFWTPPLALLFMWASVGLLSFRKRQFPQDQKRIVAGLAAVTILVSLGMLGLISGDDHTSEFSRALYQWIGSLPPANMPLASLGFLAIASVPAYLMMKSFAQMDVPPSVAMKAIRTSRG
jgi:hypothetical protein